MGNQKLYNAALARCRRLVRADAGTGSSYSAYTADACVCRAPGHAGRLRWHIWTLTQTVEMLIRRFGEARQWNLTQAHADSLAEVAFFRGHRR